MLSVCLRGILFDYFSFLVHRIEREKVITVLHKIKFRLELLSLGNNAHSSSQLLCAYPLFISLFQRRDFTK